MNLIICSTPLHVLIAEKIVELYRNDTFVFQMIVNVDNEKNRNYYEKLSKKVFKSNLIVISNKNLFFYLIGCFYLKLKSLLFFWEKGLDIDNIFIANIDNKNIHIQIYLYSFLKNIKGHLYTFDDGAANLDSGSFLYRCNDGKLKSFFKKIVKLALFSHISMYDIHKIVYGHYTIYHSNDIAYSNYNNIHEIKLFDYGKYGKKENCNITRKNMVLSVLDSQRQNTVYKILLGQPFYELFSEKMFSEDNYWNLVDNIILNFSINAYFLHPRERKRNNSINYIDTDLIFEDFLFELYSSSEFDKFVIYTFFSSAVLNLLDLPKVEIIFLETPLIKDKSKFIFEKCKQYIKDYSCCKDGNIKLIQVNF